MKAFHRLTCSSLAIAVALSAAPAFAQPGGAPAKGRVLVNSETLTGNLRSSCAMAFLNGKALTDTSAQGAKTGVACVAGQLDAFAEAYRGRARRRQLQVDGLSGATSVATLGLMAALSSGATGVTQSAWSVGTAGPLLFHDLTALDHRAMLLVAGADALSDVAERYRRLEDAVAALGEITPPDLGRISGQCRDLVQARDVFRAAREDSRRTQALAAVEELLARCEATRAATVGLAAYKSAWAFEQPNLPERAALDGLEVSRRVDVLSRALRASPFQAFQATAAAPFLTVGGILKGDPKVINGRADPRDGRDYVIRLRSLSPVMEVPAELKVDSPWSPALAQALDEIKADAVARAKAAAPKAGGKAGPSAEALAAADAATAMDWAIRTLRDAPGSLVPWAQTLNEGRGAALRVQALDGDRQVNVDPRILTARVEAAAAAAADDKKTPAAGSGTPARP